MGNSVKALFRFDTSVHLWYAYPHITRKDLDIAIIMNLIRIFISSVQREFAHEREALRDYLRGDPLMRRFFDVFLFEDVPASDCRPDSLYLDEVDQSNIYVGLFGDERGGVNIWEGTTAVFDFLGY